MYPTPERWKRWTAVLLLLSLLTEISLFFYAGTIGDPKTGINGDPAAAIRFENYAAPFLFAAVFFASLYYAAVTKERGLARAIKAVLIAIPSFIAFWLVGIMSEGCGISLG